MFLAQAVGLPIDPAQLNIMAIGRCEFTINAASATNGVRNFGLGIFPTQSSAGLMAVTWNTFLSGTATVGAFGTNTALPPMLQFQMGSNNAAIHGVAWVQSINITGATVLMASVSHVTGTQTGGVTAAVLNGQMLGTMYVIPNQAVIASAFTCVTLVSAITGA